MSTRKLIVWVSIGLAWTAGACGDDAENDTSTAASTDGDGGTGAVGGGGQGGTAPRPWCDIIWPAFCETLFACCHDPSALQSDWGGSVEGCKNVALADCSEPPPLEFFEGVPNLTVDQERLSKCVAALEGDRAACSQSPQELLILCSLAYHGDVPLGGSCGGLTSGYQCSEGSCYSQLLAPSTPGTCKPFAAVGESCLDKPCDLVAGVTCFINEGAGTGTCQPRRATGETCDGAYQCLSGNCLGGTCQAPEQDAICNGG